MSVEEIIDIFERREEWVVKGSAMDKAIECAVELLKNRMDNSDTLYYLYDSKNHSLEQVRGNDKSTAEILKFIENECKCSGVNL